MTETSIAMAPREKMEAGGILKLLVMFRFIVAACLTKKVDACAKHTVFGNKVSQMGIMFKMSFNSSTLVNVANLQGLCFCSQDW